MNYSDYIGLPFEYGARGPDCFDCYGLVMELYYQDHGIKLKEIKSSSNIKEIAMLMSADLILWKKAKNQRGSVVLLNVCGLASHVGYAIGNDKFIHTWERSGGVVIEKMSDWRHKILGFYQYAG